MKTTLLFFLTGILTALIPGPDLTFITRSTLKSGLKNGLIASTGILTGLGAYLLISSSGISFIGSNIYFQLITGSFGFVYLMYLCINLWQENTDLSFSSKNDTKEKPFNTYIKALLVHLSNPKAIVFFGVLLTPFLKNGNILMHCIALYLGFIFSFYLYTLLIYSLKKRIQNNIMNRINKLISILFFIFSIKLFFNVFNILKGHIDLFK